jgi:integrase
MWRAEKFGEQPDRKWDEAVRRFFVEKADKRSLPHDAKMLRWSTPHLTDKALSEIDRDMIEKLIELRRVGKYARTASNGCSNSTVNRHMEAIQRVLNCAVEWGWLDKAPVIRHLPEPKGRLRFLSRDEAELLLDSLPQHMKDIAEFSLCTGLRENNVLELEWNQVSLERKVAWVHADQAKGNRAYSVPLSDRAMEILAARKGADVRYVFAYMGVPLTKGSNNSWYRALKTAGLEGQIQWHSLRHTWASWHIMAGTPLEVLKELGGWTNLASVMRYAHLSPGHVAQYANNARPTT